uniref:Uncharacterized protein n=1 Tax=viral metagenome TaxID=1070528 RepID=A0A6C0EUT9_9ZZZZ
MNEEWEKEWEEDTILDSKWIEDFQSQDKKYEKYYKDDLHHIKLHCIYINANNEIERIKKEEVHLRSPNYISREEIIGILKRNSIINNQRYSVLSILKYNIDIEPSDVQFFLMDKDSGSGSNSSSNTFLTSIKNIDAIPLNQSINMFSNLNNLLVIYNEKVMLTNNNNNTITQHHNNTTKKIYINPVYRNKKHNKTQRVTLSL